MQQQLILASGSPYRHGQLEQLQLNFDVLPADIDETPRSDESPIELAYRLARAKAEAVLKHHAHAIVIGADQVAMIDNVQQHKPGTSEKAMATLAAASNKQMQLISAICVASETQSLVDHELITVQFRELTTDEIENYVQLDQPLDCAGAFKSESMGSLLTESIHSNDPSAIIGLPLIKLGDMLRIAGINPLS